jgi:hypothetical protein
VIPYWNYVGNTVVSNKFIRLTADVQSQKGAIWNMVPVQFTDWEMQVQFKISGHGRDLFGDGLAIWYAKEPNVLGDVFGYKNYFHGLAIFLDTYSNHNGQHNVCLFLFYSQKKSLHLFIYLRNHDCHSINIHTYRLWSIMAACTMIMIVMAHIHN